MIRKERLHLILSTLMILFAGCQPSGELLENPRTREIEQGTVTIQTEIDSTTVPSPSSLAAPVETVESTTETDLSTAVISTRDLSTPLPAPIENTQPDAILIFGLAESSKDSVRVPGTEAYEQAVVTAVTTDLAQRINGLTDEILVEKIGRTEVQRAAPCGNDPRKTEALNDGLSIGYELILVANNTTYRYVAIGGLAYYCSQQ